MKRRHRIPVIYDLLAGRWVDTLTTLYTEYQMNTFVFWPSSDRERQSRIFAEEVVPLARQALASGTA